jgi:hypothetical protein
MDTPKISPMENVIGRAPVTVSHLDGSTEEVGVAQFHLDRCADFLKVIDDELAQADFLCDRPPGWARTLTVESVENIIAEGDRLNADFFARWVRRRVKRMGMIAPGSVPTLEQVALTNSSPKSASPSA